MRSMAGIATATWRKDSRTWRFTRFLATELPTACANGQAEARKSQFVVRH